MEQATTSQGAVLYLGRWLSGSNSVVECQLPKLDVTGSSPVSRSIFNNLETPTKLVTPITPLSRGHFNF
jgi:hypothetical protein